MQQPGPCGGRRVTPPDPARSEPGFGRAPAREWDDPKERRRPEGRRRDADPLAVRPAEELEDVVLFTHASHLPPESDEADITGQYDFVKSSVW